MKQNNNINLMYFILGTLVLTAAAVIISYQFLDHPIAVWFYVHHLPYEWLLQSFTQLPEALLALSIVGYLAYIVAWQLNRITPPMQNLLMICHSIVISSFIKDQAKWVFGRFWPLTWRDNNPAFIPDNIDGFNFMHGNAAHSAFPSGHTTVTFAAMIAITLLYPRLKWLSIPCMVLVPVALLVLDFHYLSDIIAGAALGFIVAMCTITLCRQ